MDALRKGLGNHQYVRAARRSTEDTPAIGAEMFAQLPQIGEGILCRMDTEIGARLAGVWCALFRTALVEQDDVMPRQMTRLR